MERIAFGGTGLGVLRIALGTWAFGDMWMNTRDSRYR